MHSASESDWSVSCFHVLDGFNQELQSDLKKGRSLSHLRFFSPKSSPSPPSLILKKRKTILTQKHEVHSGSFNSSSRGFLSLCSSSIKSTQERCLPQGVLWSCLRHWLSRLPYQLCSKDFTRLFRLLWWVNWTSEDRSLRPPTFDFYPYVFRFSFQIPSRDVVSSTITKT